jgi:hypothetical protein
MAQVVGAELGLEAVGRRALAAGHDTGVGDDEIERLAGCNERVGAGPDARQRRQIELNEFKPAAIRRRARTCSVAALALLRSRAAPTTSAPCAASARAVSTPSPAETPVTRTRLPLRSTPSRTSSVVDVAPNGSAMGVTLLDFDFGPFWASTVSMTIALARLFRKGVPEAASGAKFRDSLKLTGGHRGSGRQDDPD